MASSSNVSKDNNTRITIFILTILLTVAFILAAVFLGSPDDDDDNNNGYSVSGTLSTSSSGTSITVPRSGYIYYRFTPSSTGTYKIYSTSSSSSSDPKAVLYNSNWSQLQSNDDGGTGNNFSISYNLTSGSTYYVGIGQSGSASGSITIRVYVETENNSGGSDSNKTISGTLITGSNGTSITVPTSGYIYYRFTPSSTGTYKIYSTSSSSSSDPKAVLYNSNWSQLQSNDDGGTGNNFSISYNLTSGSTYYVGIGQSGSASGSITIRVYVETN